MAIDVRSEVRPLKKVLLQRPGRELEQLVPNSMERLLFDDIPYLRGAQTEHDRFAQVLRDSGVEVVYLTDLAAETLALSDSCAAASLRTLSAAAAAWPPATARPSRSFCWPAPTRASSSARP